MLGGMGRATADHAPGHDKQPAGVSCGGELEEAVAGWKCTGTGRKKAGETNPKNKVNFQDYAKRVLERVESLRFLQISGLEVGEVGGG